MAMTAFQMYRKLEDWSELACKQKWGSDWTEHIGESLSVYLGERASKNKGASLEGFINYLEDGAPKEGD